MSIEQLSKYVKYFCQRHLKKNKFVVITLFFFMGCGRLVVEVEIMSGLIDFLTTEEMIVVYSLVGIASVLYLIIYFFDKTYYKRKQRQNTRELQKIVDEISPVEDKKEDKVVSSEPVLIPIQEEESRKDVVVEVSDQAVTPMENEEVSSLEEVVKKDAELLTTTEIKEDTVSLESISDIENSSLDEVKQEEELQYTSIEPDPIEAQAELMKLTEALEQAEAEVKNIELTAFEEEQEQNAIISLDELMSRGKAMYESGELEKLEDEGNEPISIQDLEERMKVANESSGVVSVTAEPVIAESSPITEQMVLNDFQTVSIEEEAPVKPEESTVYQEHKKFKSSPIISPVFGIEKMEATTASDIELENTANFEKLDEEIRKTNEFLMTLKELQKKLD